MRTSQSFLLILSAFTLYVEAAANQSCFSFNLANGTSIKEASSSFTITAGVAGRATTPGFYGSVFMATAVSAYDKQSLTGGIGR